jgi:hypothetical protein
MPLPLALRGYLTLAFDHRNFGASEGGPRQHEDTEESSPTCATQPASSPLIPTSTSSASDVSGIHDRIAGPRSLIWLETTEHIDLYDNATVVDAAVQHVAGSFDNQLVGSF